MLWVNLPDRALRYFHGICCYRPQIKHNTALIQRSALSNLCEAVSNSSVFQSWRNSRHSLCFLQLRNGTKCSAWREGSILKYSTAAALTACLLPHMSNAAVRKIKTSTARRSGTCQLDNHFCHFLKKLTNDTFMRSRFSASFPSISSFTAATRLMSAPQLYHSSC